MIYKGYEIAESSGHGKKVKGMKHTSTIQVREHDVPGGYLLKAQIRFTVGDEVRRQAAIEKAKRWVDKQGGR